MKILFLRRKKEVAILCATVKHGVLRGWFKWTLPTINLAQMML